MENISYREIKSYYTCQECQKEFESKEEIKIIPFEFPLCFKCKNNVEKVDEEIKYHFGDNLLIFDEETRNIFESFINNFEFLIYNGYLARKKDEKIEFFHRLIFEDELEIIGKEFQVHHVNENKLDNRKINLELIKKEDHYNLHKHKRYMKAYSTWSRKVYGEYNEEEHMEEFDEWLMEKGDIW